jgi:putative membrane protein
MPGQYTTQSLTSGANDRYTAEQLDLPENAGIRAARVNARDHGYAGVFGNQGYDEYRRGLMGGSSQLQTGGGGATAGLTTARLTSGQEGLLLGQEAARMAAAGLTEGQANLTTGQANLTAGQVGLTAGQAGLTAGQADLTTGQATLGQGQATLAQMGVDNTLALQGTMGEVGDQVGGVQTGVTGLQQSVGQAATEQDPSTGLYAGQTGLGTGQTGLMTGQQQLGNQLGQEIGGVSADISSFQRAMDAYQRGADTQRGEIQSAGLQGREQISNEIGTVGIQANRSAEMMAAARQQMLDTPQGAALLGAGNVSQQAAQYAQAAQNYRRNAQQQQVEGTLGPTAADPRSFERRRRYGLMG